jgi:hypothetical protein
MGRAPSDKLGFPTEGSDFLFFLGHRIMRLGTLDVAAFLDQVADLVRWDRQLALRTGVQGGGDQEVVSSPIPFGRFGLPSLRYGHDTLSRKHCFFDVAEKKELSKSGAQLQGHSLIDSRFENRVDLVPVRLD